MNKVRDVKETGVRNDLIKVGEAAQGMACPIRGNNGKPWRRLACDEDLTLEDCGSDRPPEIARDQL
jgi:hypothetical protein